MRRHGVVLIEDAAEALGATYRGQRCRRSAGRGGVLVQRQQDHHHERRRDARLATTRTLIEHARKLSTQAREPAPHYEHTEIGFNYRLSNLLAAVGRAQLESLPGACRALGRGSIERYRELLGDVPGIAFMPEAPYGTATIG